MALQKNMSLTGQSYLKINNIVNDLGEQTITVNNVYIKIDDYQGNKASIILNVGLYKDSTLKQKYCSKQYTFTPNISNAALNFIKQGYEYLKTLDEYKDATDLLDEGQTA